MPSVRKSETVRKRQLDDSSAGKPHGLAQHFVARRATKWVLFFLAEGTPQC